MMTNAERDFYLRIIDDVPGVVPIVYEISKYKHSLDIQVFLIKNNLTGKNLLSWLKNDFSNSILTMIKFVIQKINNERDLKPVIVGKDYFVK